MQLASDDHLVHLSQVDKDLFFLTQLGCSIERVFPHVEHDLFVPLHVVVAERELLAQRANWRLLEGINVEERLGALVVELLLVEEVRQRLLDVAADLVDDDLLGRVDADALDPRPDLVLVGIRVVERGQLAPERRVELAAVGQLAYLGRRLDHSCLVALAGYVVCHREINWRVSHLRCHDRDYRGNTYRPRRDLVGRDRDFRRVVGQR